MLVNLGSVEISPDAAKRELIRTYQKAINLLNIKQKRLAAQLGTVEQQKQMLQEQLNTLSVVGTTVKTVLTTSDDEPLCVPA